MGDDSEPENSEIFGANFDDELFDGGKESVKWSSSPTAAMAHAGQR